MYVDVTIINFKIYAGVKCHSTVVADDDVDDDDAVLISIWLLSLPQLTLR